MSKEHPNTHTHTVNHIHIQCVGISLLLSALALFIQALDVCSLSFSPLRCLVEFSFKFSTFLRVNPIGMQRATIFGFMFFIIISFVNFLYRYFAFVLAVRL